MTKVNPQIKIKKEFEQTVVAFGRNGLPLGKRPISDLIDLGIMARDSGHKKLINFFEQLPTLAELKTLKMQGVEKTITKSGIENKSDK